MMNRRFLLSIIISAFVSLTAAFSQDRQTRVENGLVEAVSMYNDGEFSSARKLLNSLVSLDPQNDAVCYYLGLCNFALRDMDSAESYLSRALALDPGNYWYHDRLAAFYMALNRVPQAIGVYEGMINAFPRTSDPYYALVSLYARNNQGDKMLEVLDRIVEMSGESPQIFVMQGDANMASYEDSLALTFYEKALALDPEYAPAILGKAEALRLQRRYDDYFDYLDKYISSDYVMPEGKSDYLQTLFHNMDGRFFQNFQPRLDSLASKVVALHPQDSTVLQCVGSYYFNTGRLEEAKEHFRSNKELHPDSYGAAAMYVQFLSYSGDFQEMAEECERAFEAFPFEPAFQEYKVIAYYSMQDYVSALRENEKIIAMYPNDPERLLNAYSTGGDLYHRTGDMQKCYDCYEKALKIDPDNALCLNNYAYFMCLEGKKLNKALKMSKRAVELEPDNASYLDTIGWILHLKGKDEDAKTYFKRAMIYGGKDSYECLNHYAQVLEALKETDLSKYYYDLAKEKQAEEEQ